MAERKNLANMKVKKKSADDKPWEKMYTGKTAEKSANKSADKAKATGKSADKAKTAGAGKGGDKYKTAGAGKAGDKYKTAGTKPASAGKAVKDEKSVVKKVVKEPRDFLYLLPKKTTAKSLAKVLDFLDKKAVEVWDDECILEITTKEGVITFEDIRESLEKNDLKILNDLRTKQVLSCDYESTNSELVQKIMTTFLKEFGGKIGSDTEDFEPFVPVEKL